MKFFTRYCVLLLISILAAACSRNNVGDIFPPYGKFDPEQQGWIKNDDGTFVLYAMEAGAIYSSQTPELLALFPASDATSVDVKTLILLRFNKTMALDADAIQIKPAQESNPAPITGTWQFAPGSAGTVLVFEPDEDLAPDTAYEIELTNTLSSAMGESFIADSETETQETTFQFTTGGADDKIEFGSVENFTLPPDQATDVFEGASMLVFFTEAVNTESATDGLMEAEEGSDNLTVKDQDNNAIAGTRSFYLGNRLLVFEPDESLPAGKRIDMAVAGRVKNSEGDETLGSDVTTSFTVINVPRTTALAFPDSTPLIVRPSTLYPGMLNLATDRDAYSVDVTLEGSGTVSRITLIFWNGTDKAIIEAFDGTFTSRTHSFTVDLIPLEAEEASNDDPLGATDNVVTVGAFTTRSGVSTPLGPALELPLLRKDLEPPALTSLGPPNETDDGLALLSEMADLGIHGRASEDLTAVTITFEINGFEQDPTEGIKFFSVEYPAASGTLSEEVTLGEDHLFLTEPLDLDTSGVFPGGGFDGPSMSRAEPPVEITQVVLTDLVGNTATIDDPADATVDFRGYFLPATSGTAEIEVICSDAVTLRPIEDVDLVVENVTQGLVIEGVHTDEEGTAEFGAFPSNILWTGNRMVLTAIKAGYQVVSVVWSYEYSFIPENKTLSLVLVPEQTVDLNTSLEITFENRTLEALSELFVSGTDQVVQSGESLVSMGENPADGTVTVRSNMLQILQVLGIQTDPVEAFQWAWLDPLITIGGEVNQQTAYFLEEAIEPIADEYQDLVVTPGLAANADRQVGLTAVLPGFKNSLMLSVDRTATGASPYAFSVPLPPTLLTNQAFSTDDEGLLNLPLDLAEFEPPSELIIEPALGSATNTADPDTDLFEELLYFEAEEIATGDPPAIIRRRILYDHSLLTVQRDIVMPEGMGKPSIDGDELKWKNVLNNSIAAGTGVYILRYVNPSGTRQWQVTIDQAEGGTNYNSNFTFPDLDSYDGMSGLSGEPNGFDDFTAAGDYAFQAEAYQVPSFDLTSSFFSAISTKWETYWRSSEIKVTK